MDDSAGVLEVNVLGPFEVVLDGRRMVFTTGRLRALLAVLAMSAGRGVSPDRLATAVWGDDPPSNGRRTVQLYVTRLRGALGAAAITTGPTGYALRTVPDNVDALRFLRLLDTDSAEPAAARVRLAEALALWRGTPFDGVHSSLLERTEAPRLVERYLAATERRVDLDLADGRHLELVAELAALTAQHPLRESLWVRLLVALDRSGRQAEALEQYETVRTRLAEELGTDPGPELRQAHADLLAGSPVAGGAGAAPPAVPRQLPSDLDGFTGRHTALKTLDDLLGGLPDRPGSVMVSLISGTAGVGKTTLAVHWAHQISGQFPDGQLYANLRGYGAGEPTDPGTVVRGFLDALDVPAHRIPADPAAQTGLYRSMLAGRRMLVVLDNARDADQVRPLLPGSPCLVIVTSRSQLASLIVTEAAHPVPLDLLSIEDARVLLARRLGQHRIAAEPAAVDAIIASCARLPLALAIAAARAAGHPHLPLSTLAAELRDHQHRSLDVLTTHEPSTDVRTVFSWSYRTLSPAAALLFRLLGLHPGPDITVPAAASMAALPVREARSLLAELTRANLLSEHTPARYRFHDLLSAYAAELVEHDPEIERRAAIHRLLDYYLCAAHATDRVLAPQRDLVRLPARQPGVVDHEIGDYPAALAWFTEEHRVLLAAVALAARHGFDPQTWQLAWALATFLHRRGHWHDWLAVQRAAVAAAAQLGDPVAQSRSHRMLAQAYRMLARDDDAERQVRTALRLAQRQGDHAGQAHAHLLLARLLRDDEEALGHAQCALDICQAINHKAVSDALYLTGWLNAKLGRLHQALAMCEEALSLLDDRDNPNTRAATMDGLGYVYHRLGDYQQAIRHYESALDLRRRLGHRYEDADTLNDLGDVHHTVGDHAAARHAWGQALARLIELGHPDAEQVRAKLARLEQPVTH